MNCTHVGKDGTVWTCTGPVSSQDGALAVTDLTSITPQSNVSAATDIIFDSTTNITTVQDTTPGSLFWNFTSLQTISFKGGKVTLIDISTSNYGKFKNICLTNQTSTSLTVEVKTQDNTATLPFWINTKPDIGQLFTIYVDISGSKQLQSLSFPINEIAISNDSTTPTDTSAITPKNFPNLKQLTINIQANHESPSGDFPYFMLIWSQITSLTIANALTQANASYQLAVLKDIFYNSFSFLTAFTMTIDSDLQEIDLPIPLDLPAKSTFTINRSQSVANTNNALTISLNNSTLDITLKLADSIQTLTIEGALESFTSDLTKTSVNKLYFTNTTSLSTLDLTQIPNRLFSVYLCDSKYNLSNVTLAKNTSRQYYAYCGLNDTACQRSLHAWSVRSCPNTV